MIENVIQNKNRRTISVNVNVNSQKNIAYAKTIMFEILAYMFKSVIRIVKILFDQIV